jgi:hypothetical protein
MWNRKRSTFLLIKIRIPSRFGFTFPLLLPVAEETLEGITDLIALGKSVYNRDSFWVSVICSSLQAGREALREMRALGPIDLVEINTPEAEVAVKLW